MAKHRNEANLAWFVAGVSVGIAGAILLAPKSGRETRQTIAEAATKGREFALEQKRQATQFAHELYEKGRDLVGEMKEANVASEAGDGAEQADSAQG